MKTKIVLYYKDLFPNEMKLEPLEYLLEIPKKTLLKIISFLNTNHSITYNNFFSNPQIRIEINQRITLMNNHFSESVLITPFSQIRLTELVLSNIDKFQEGNSDFKDELNLFKVILILNEEYSTYNHHLTVNSTLDDIIKMFLLNSFQYSEYFLHKENNTPDLFQILYTTFYKIIILIDHLNLKEPGLKTFLLESYNVHSKKEFFYQVKLFLAHILIGKLENDFFLNKQDFENQEFLKAITITNLRISKDFTDLKRKPIYFIDDQQFSIVNPFFTFDHFYKGIIFKCLEFYKSRKEQQDFLSNFKLEFSEKTLMKKVLDDVFEKKYFIKKENLRKNDYEPDYYVNYRNSILLFENKDILIPKKIKSSRNVEDILNFLQEKLIQNKNGKRVGINQIINSIESIYKKSFQFDNSINYNKKITIFPILILHDRAFDTLGINYLLNKSFEDELAYRNIISNNKFQIYSLTILNIDTIIFSREYFQNNFSKFKSFLINHHQKMKKQIKHNKIEYYDRQIKELILPISQRKKIPLPQDFISHFEILKNYKKN